MRKRVYSALAALLLLLAGVSFWQGLREREPVYQGKRLSLWLESYNPEGTSPQVEVDKALCNIGSNAIPSLLGMLQAEDSPLMLKLREYRVFWRLGPRYTLAETRQMQAVRGFRALGANASNAVPALIEIYERRLSPSCHKAAADSLVEIGPAAKKAIPAFVKSATSTNSSVRAIAVYSLGRMALESELVVPVLINALHDGDREVRYNAAFGLGATAYMGGDARMAIPALIETLNDSYRTARAAAATALGLIHGGPGLVVPALTEALHDPEMVVRACVADALAKFGPDARPAAGALLELLSKGNQDAKAAASKALKAIDLEAAAKTGVK